MFLVTLLYFSLSHRPGFSTNPAPGVGRLSIGCCILFKTVPPSEPHTRYVAPRYQNCATGADSSECKVFFTHYFISFIFFIHTFYKSMQNFGPPAGYIAACSNYQFSRHTVCMMATSMFWYFVVYLSMVWVAPFGIPRLLVSGTSSIQLVLGG